MTSYPGQPTPPRRTFLWLAIGSFVIGLILAGLFAWRVVQTAPKAPVPIGDSTVHVDKEGLTVYSSTPVLSPACEAKDSNGSDVPLRPISGSETITINSETWYVVVRTVNPVPAGDYVISCTDNETGTTYAVGPRTAAAGFVVSILGLIGSVLIFFGVGLVLLIVAAVTRRRARHASTSAPHPPTADPPYQPGPPYQPDPQYRPGPAPDDRPEDR
jgi:hypothetical protein